MKKKNKDIIKRYSREILVGIITSAICFLIQWLIKCVPKTGKNIFGTIQNIVYSSAAIISTERILVTILLIALTPFLAMPILLFLSKIIRLKSENDDSDFEMECKEYERKIDELHTEIEELENTQPKNNEKIEKCLKEIDICNKEFLSDKTSLKKKNKIGTLIICLLVPYLFLVYLIYAIPMYILIDFNRDIKMIKPYTNQNSIILLESDWTRMKSKDDYDKIYDTINKVKKEKNLPKK